MYYISRPPNHNHKESEPEISQDLTNSYHFDNLKDVIKASTYLDRFDHIENKQIGSSMTSDDRTESHKRLPTLTDVSDLFEEYYSCVQYYPWRYGNQGTVKPL